jgi:hypothetical protein
MFSFLYGCHKPSVVITDLSYTMVNAEHERVPFERIDKYKRFVLEKENEKYKKFIFRNIQHKIRNFINLSSIEIDKIRSLDEEDKIKLIQILNHCIEVLVQYLNIDNESVL